jgi:hypothetical protein
MNCFDFCAHLIRYVVVNEKKSSRAIAVNAFINEQESMLTDQQFLSYSKLKNQGKSDIEALLSVKFPNEDVNQIFQGQLYNAGIKDFYNDNVESVSDHKEITVNRAPIEFQVAQSKILKILRNQIDLNREIAGWEYFLKFALAIGFVPIIWTPYYILMNILVIPIGLIATVQRANKLNLGFNGISFGIVTFIFYWISQYQNLHTYLNSGLRTWEMPFTEELKIVWLIAVVGNMIFTFAGLPKWVREAMNEAKIKEVDLNKGERGGGEAEYSDQEIPLQVVNPIQKESISELEKLTIKPDVMPLTGPIIFISIVILLLLLKLFFS